MRCANRASSSSSSVMSGHSSALTGGMLTRLILEAVPSEPESDKRLVRFGLCVGEVSAAVGCFLAVVAVVSFAVWLWTLVISLGVSCRITALPLPLSLLMDAVFPSSTIAEELPESSGVMVEHVVLSDGNWEWLNDKDGFDGWVGG